MILEIKNNHIMRMEFDEKTILSMGFSIHYFGKENSFSIPTKQKGTHFILQKDGTLLVHDEYDTIKLIQVKSMEELSTILSVFC
jgi:protein associated with RNAse G/E